MLPIGARGDASYWFYGRPFLLVLGAGFNARKLPFAGGVWPASDPNTLEEQSFKDLD